MPLNTLSDLNQTQVTIEVYSAVSSKSKLAENTPYSVFLVGEVQKIRWDW